MSTIHHMTQADRSAAISMILAEAGDINSDINVIETAHRLRLSLVEIGVTAFCAALDERRASIKEGARL